MNKIIIVALFFLMVSCHNEDLQNGIYWNIPLNQKSLIYDSGLGYPVYKNTVVFHSTPEPWGIHQSILHGLDTETGKEKWRLTNADFYPKKDMRFNNAFYFYQYENIVVACDFAYQTSQEHYIYAIDIDKGKVLWIKEMPSGYTQIGRLVRGSGKDAYIDAQQDTTKFTLFKIDIETGNYSEVFNFTKDNLPHSIPEKRVSFFQFSEIYKNSNNEDLIACSFNGYNSDKNIRKSYMTLFVYNLSKEQAVYSTYVNSQTNESDWDDVDGHVCYFNNKILIGKGRNVYCYDAFSDNGSPLWQHSSILNDGVGRGSGNDYVTQVFGHDNILLAFCIDHLIAFDINTGKLLYNVSANGGSAAAIIDGILYDEDHNDFLMRDPNTGKELKRISTGKNEEGFSSSRPNGADGRIYIHTYSDAYCINAWGK